METTDPVADSVEGLTACPTNLKGAFDAMRGGRGLAMGEGAHSCVSKFVIVALTNKG
jgi:hypothetical protein